MLMVSVGLHPMEDKVMELKEKIIAAVNTMSKDELDRLLLHIETVKYVHKDKYNTEADCII